MRISFIIGVQLAVGVVISAITRASFTWLLFQLLDYRQILLRSNELLHRLFPGAPQLTASMLIAHMHEVPIPFDLLVSQTLLGLHLILHAHSFSLNDKMTRKILLRQYHGTIVPFGHVYWLRLSHHWSLTPLRNCHCRWRKRRTLRLLLGFQDLCSLHYAGFRRQIACGIDWLRLSWCF